MFQSETEAVFDCKICQKVFKNKMGLMRHKSKQHIQCIKCSLVFGSKSSLQEHLLRAHTKDAVLSVEAPPASPPPPPMTSSQEEEPVDLDDLFSSIGAGFESDAPVTREVVGVRGHPLHPSKVSAGPRDEPLGNFGPFQGELAMDDFDLSQNTIHRSSTPLDNIVDNYCAFEEEDLFTAELF